MDTRKILIIGNESIGRRLLTDDLEEVVYAVSLILAEKLQRRPGLGIRFIHFLEDADTVFDEYFHDRVGKDSPPVSMGQTYVMCPGGEIHEQI